MCTNAWERLSDTLEVFLFVSSHDSAIMNFLNMYLPVDNVSKTFRQKKEYFTVNLMLLAVQRF